MLRGVYLGLAALVLAAVAAAEPASRGLPSIERAPGELQQLATTDQIRPFEAVGRLDTGDGFCTATLIAPNLVLTAAHCLFDSRDNTRRDESDFIFNAGLRNGRVSAQRGIRESFVHPGYAYGAPDRIERVRTDIALLELDRPITAAAIAPLPARGQARVGDEVHVVSYGEDREQVASLEQGCEILGGDPGVQVLSCNVVQGSSGSPVMIREGAGYAVVGVVSASAHWREEPVGLSAELDGGYQSLLAAVSGRSPGLAASAMPQIRTLGSGSGDGRATAGARFVRPDSN